MEQIEERDVEVVVNGLSTEAVQSREVHMRRSQYKVLVEKVEHKLSIPDVIEPAMVHQETPEEAELTEGEVTRLHGTHALVTVQANANVRFFDHGYIVGTISDGKRDRV